MIGFRVTPVDEPATLLGVPFTTDYSLAQARAFDRRVPALWAARKPWEAVHLNLLGRAHVAKQCLASKLVYHAAFHSPRRNTMQQLEACLRHFVANSADPVDQNATTTAMHPGTNTAVLPFDDGGIAMAHLPSMVAAMQAKAITSLFSPGTHPWKPLMLAAFAAADAVAGVPTWVVTAAGAGALRRALTSPRLRDYVNSFLKLGPHRIIPPEHQSFFSTMAEPLYHNAQVRGGLLSPAAFHTQLGRSWRYLRDVRAAVARWPNLSDLEQQDVRHVLDNVPQCWAERARAEEEPSSGWQCAAFLGTQWVMDNDGCLRKVHTSGRILHGVEMGEIPAGLHPMRWTPAAVYPKEKPKVRWTQEDYDMAEEAREHDEDYMPTEDWLLGPWGAVQLDPAVWGFAGRSLAGYTVRDARTRLVHLHRAAEDDTYVPGRGLRPRIWRPSTASEPGLRFQVEQRWAEEYRRRLEGGTEAGGSSTTTQRRTAADFEQALEETEPAWMRAPSAQHPRPSPQQRAEARRTQQFPPQQAARDDTKDKLTELVAARGTASNVSYRRVWKDLQDRTLARSHRATVWRLLHGALGVRAAKMAFNPSLPCAEGCCTAEGCHNALETLSHALYDCPHVRPVWQWLRSVWAGLTTHEPPDDVRVLLGGEDEVWAPQPQEAAHLWRRLRVACIHSIWWCRSHRSIITTTGVSLATRASMMVVDHMQACIRRDYIRCNQDVRHMHPAVPSVWFKGRDPMLKQEDFEEDWCAGGYLADINSEDCLIIKLTTRDPVPLPTGQGRAGGVT